MSRNDAKELLLALAPAVLLNLVAISQLILVRTVDLAPWKGGGFGMFSTMDDGAIRPIGIRVTGPEGDRLIPLPKALEGRAHRVTLMPSESMLREMAIAIGAGERARGRSVQRVHVAVWRMAYDPRTLEARPEVVQQAIVDFGTRQ